jgi:hypothetical protein
VYSLTSRARATGISPNFVHEQEGVLAASGEGCGGGGGLGRGGVVSLLDTLGTRQRYEHEGVGGGGSEVGGSVTGGSSGTCGFATYARHPPLDANTDRYVDTSVGSAGGFVGAWEGGGDHASWGGGETNSSGGERGGRGSRCAGQDGWEVLWVGEVVCALTRSICRQSKP